ncbi:MAG TPA: hypothetical protein VJ777_14150 [Mycobacterium sp.]|nr:hypothetical protein [Mycobacterium sp.]
MMMTAIYLAHLEHKPGEVVTNPRRNNFSEGWVDLSGLMDRAANSKENNLRVTRALRKLANARLVTVGPPGQRDRFEGFKLKRENGKGDKDYKVPGESLMLRQAALLPAEFFYYGWHLVLTPEELATFLVIVMETQFRAHHPRSVLIGDQGIGLSRKVRWRDYGLASEAYNSIHELKEFGLIDLVDPMVGRKGGKVKDPKALDMRAYRLIWPPSPDATAVPGPAFDVVTNCLTENPSPPRTDT